MNPTTNVLLDLLHLISSVVDGLTSQDDLKSFVKLVEDRILNLESGPNGV